MAKKKKTQLKPIARGFATKSIPKKVTQSEDESTSKVMPQDTLKPTKTEVTSNPPELVGATNSVDPEQERLQRYVDNYQDRTEKEINRMVKFIEQERRFATTFPSVQMGSGFAQGILDLVLRADAQSVVPPVIQDTEGKALPKLAITYGVLRKIGFSDDRVFQCLKSIPGIELDDAIEWLYTHCEEEELGGVNGDFLTDGSELPRTIDGSKNLLPSTSNSAVSSTPPPLHSTPPTPNVPDASITRPATPQPIFLTQSLPPSVGTVVDRSQPESEDDLTASFVRLKMQITELTTHRAPGESADTASLHELQRRLKVIKDDYLFDEEEAERAYQAELSRVNAALLQTRLRGDDDSGRASQPTKASSLMALEQRSNKSSSSSQPREPEDIFDTDSGDDTPGGLLELLEAMPTSETTPQGTVIAVRDMAFPKHWSGRTPKSLLEETVRRTERGAAVVYRVVSGHSRAKRAAITIRWERRTSEEWCMDHVACYDAAQAEQYVATVALHALAFPRQEGFALGNTATVSNQTSFRLLPPIYRDLWAELEERRQRDDNVTNRDIWGRLRTSLQPKLVTPTQPNTANTKLAGTQLSDVSRRVQRYDAELEHIVADFRTRRASFAYQDMLHHRNTLPIARHRQDILNLLETSQILVLSGETGCGKSTQLPAFILEDRLSQGKHCRIICTEPRRISAISLAQRVSVELGEPVNSIGSSGSLVGYTVRLESNTSKTTRLSYVTNGIALRMLEGGSGTDGKGMAFDEVTHIIIDEVHERTIESDFLLIVLKSLVHQRPDIRVVLMSATVDAEKISAYFGGCPVLRVPGRTFPVDVRYLEDAVELTRWKITENSPYARHGGRHKNKPQMDWLEELLPPLEEDDDVGAANVKLEKRYSPDTVSTINLLDDRLVPFDLIIRLLEYICFEDPVYMSYSAAVLVFMPGIGEIRQLYDTLMEHTLFGSDAQFHIFPLHSTISSEQQSAVFEVPASGARKIVVSTNIAETGVTIPDVTCVIDSGKHREMRFDEKRQISRLVDTYVAKSNATQRRGRAGRVRAGLCFHLFTKFRYDTKMADHPDPEIMRLSLSDLALRIKIMKVSLGASIEDVLSRALDPPLPINIQRAVSALIEVKALTATEEITPMGRLLSKLPTDVHLGKFLLVSTLFCCLDPALTIAAALNSKSPFVTPFGLAEEADRAKTSFRTENSDFLTIHNAFTTWRTACANGASRRLCRQYFLSHQNLLQIEELRQQYLGYLIDLGFVKVDRGFARELNRSRFYRGRPRLVAVPPELDANSSNAPIVNAALTAGLYPKILTVGSKDGKNDLRTITNNQSATFHPSSINFGRKFKDFGTNYLCYFTLMHSKKLYAWETGPVDDLALLLLCGDAEIKLLSNMVSIDRKVRYQIEPKTGIALKLARNQLSQILATQYRCKPLSETQRQWNDVVLKLLGKVDVEESRREAVTFAADR